MRAFLDMRAIAMAFLRRLCTSEAPSLSTSGPETLDCSCSLGLLIYLKKREREREERERERGGGGGGEEIPHLFLDNTSIPLGKKLIHTRFSTHAHNYLVTVDTPSTNLVLKRTLALLNMPSLRETTTNWECLK